MTTELVSAYTEDGSGLNEELIRRAGRILREGGLVAFPTETVYGLGGDALNPASSKKIYAAKGRPSDNPLIVHIAELEALSAIVKKIPEAALALAEQFWPGPLTMIFEKSDLVPMETTGGLSTVAVRMPDHPAALRLIREAGGYIAAPSANRSGRPSPTLASHVYEDLAGNIEMILDGGHATIGLESTILDLSVEKPVILRPGYITKEEIFGVPGMEENRAPGGLHKTSNKEDFHPKAPGMKYRHYAPKGDMTVLCGPMQRVAEALSELSRAASARGETVGILCSRETAERAGLSEAVLFCPASRKDPAGIAAGLFEGLRRMDEASCTVIFAEGFPEEGVFIAVMNRLNKAAGGNIIHI